MLVIGSEMWLVSLKLAALLPDTTMVVVHSSAAAAESQRLLARVMGVANLFVCHRAMSLSVVEAMSQVPEPFDVAILGAGVLAHMTDRPAVERQKLLKMLLSFAPSTYLEWPEQQALRVAMQLTHRRNVSASYDTHSLLSSAAHQAAAAGAKAHVVLITPPAHTRGTGGRARGRRRALGCSTGLWQVDVERIERRVMIAFSPSGESKTKQETYTKANTKDSTVLEEEESSELRAGTMVLTQHALASIKIGRGLALAAASQELWHARTGV